MPKYVFRKRKNDLKLMDHYHNPKPCFPSQTQNDAEIQKSHSNVVRSQK